MSKSIASIARHERIRREVLSKSDLIPSLPEVVTEILQLLNNSEADLHDFEQPLSKDAALVARMLKLVNSPFYGLRRQISTISEGVAVMGFRSLRSMVLAASTANFLERDFSCYGHDTKGLWHHSLCVGAGSRCLAQRLGYDMNFREEVFVAGLLHDIGKMLLGPYIVSERIEINGPAHLIELAELGLDHQEAGGIIAEKWNLSPLVRAVLRHHHDDQGPAEYERALAIVRLADVCSHAMRRGYVEGVELATDPSPGDLATIDFEAPQWEETATAMQEAMQSALTSLGGLDQE